MPQLGDIRTAMKMRESITDIATSVMKTLRPEDRIGTVFSFNPVNQMAEILFPGETNANLVQAHYSKNMRPMRQMVTNFGSQGYAAVGDIVRVSGKPGSYWISDYISGGPGYWVNYTPVATGLTQFIAAYTSTGKYTIIGDTVTFDCKVAVTSPGAALNEGLAVYLPYQAAFSFGQTMCVGRENQSVGSMLQGVINSEGVQVICFNYANAGIIDANRTFIFSGSYQIKIQ